jgi:polyisoprenoid-binding protein YceI
MKSTRHLGALFFLWIAANAYGQKYSIESSMVSFYSHATIEDITAENKKVAGLFNSANNEIVFSVPIKEFEFAKSLMKEHFNEKYMETEKFPKATFQGKIEGFSLTASGPQQARAIGKLTIHGVTKEIDVSGTMEVVNGKVTMKTKFVVKLEDYNITRPQVLWQNIAEQVDVTIDFLLKPI